MLTLLCSTGVWAEGELNGVFTINASGDKVQFSQGNLQATYDGSAWSWALATNQWDYIGNAASNTSINGNGTVSTNGTVDLFGWSTSATTYGIHSSNEGPTYSGDFVDWGNTIGTGWRTLTSAEWVWILGPSSSPTPGTNCRASGSTVNGTSNARYVHATINTDGTGVNGMILFPDGVTIANDEATSWGTVNGNSRWEYATKCTSAQWTALAAKGCVFLPAAGSRGGASVWNVGTHGHYWSSTPNGDYYAWEVDFSSEALQTQGNYSRYQSLSVRLVKNYQLQQDASGNYLIGSAYDWGLFANGINDGTIAINANAKLMANNITVTTMIGNSGHRYAGTFDGNNKTITLSISGTSGFEAPFSYINGATIKDLTVSGTLSGGTHCSGLIGLTNGTNNVNNVIVDCAITATGSHCSGLLGRQDNGTTTFDGCAFTGSISKASGNCNVGVLWGWNNGGTSILTNCLENGTYTNCSPLQPIGNLPSSKTVTNTFYVSNVSSSYGTRAYTSAQDGEINGQVTAVDGNNYYVLADISGINERYELLSSSVSPEPVVKFTGTTLTKDADYTVSYSNNTSRGTGSVIITGAGSYSGTKTVNFAVAATTLSGSGTEGSPFTIGSDDDWTEFAASVNSGFTFSGMYVKMTDNVNASSMAGQNDGEPFSGTFDGDHKTLNLSIVNTGSSTDIKNPSTGTAPFHYIKNAVIKNVKTTGSVSATAIHSSGLVGFADGTNTIQGCTVSATINTTADYVGGVLAHGIISNTTIQDCTFNGTVNGRSGGSSHVVGLYGWYHGGSPVVKNCLENGTYTNVSSFNPIFLKSVGADASVSETYYLNEKNEGGASGTRVFTAVPDGEMCGQVTATDGNNYYALTTISGINERYELLDESVTPVPVVKFFNTTLTHNADYNVSYSNNTSGGTGSVILTGINDYTGTKTVNFEIAANTLSGSGTEGDPYVINSNDDWMSFANSVNSGFTYSGKFVKLTKNVNTTVNVGLRDNKPFSGTFDGDGHTLTVTLTANAASTSGNTEGIAPFHFIKNATIKNLQTAGTITSTTNHTSGLVGFSEGTNAIQNCVVSTTLNVKNYVGGFIGHAQSSTIAIRDCLFNGTVNGSSSSYISAFWGWSGSSGNIVNCLENGTYIGVSGFDAIGWTPTTPTNTYRINSSSKGTATTAEALADGTTTADLQNGRAEVVWVQTALTNQPMLKIFANELSLADGDNLTALAPYAGKTCRVAYSRSFTAGKSSTVCLPFAFAKGSVGTFYTFTDIHEDGGEYIADMTEYTGANLVANTPYLFTPSATGSVDFSGTYEIPASITAGETVSGDWTYQGTYETIEWTSAPTGIYGFSAQAVAEQGISQGQFVKVGEYVRVKPMRCYLKYKNGTENYAKARGMNHTSDTDEPLPDVIKVRLIGADGHVTAIGTLQTKTGEVTLDSDVWYTLNGIRIKGKPTVKGVYVNNGKKVAIK